MAAAAEQPGGPWPFARMAGKLTQAEIAAAFDDGWRIDSMEPASIEIAVAPQAIRAWLVAATRV